jgi:hypothetical protein
VRPPRVVSFVEQPGALQEVRHPAHNDSGGFSAGVKADADERVWRGRGEAGEDVHRRQCARKLGAQRSASEQSEEASRGRVKRQGQATRRPRTATLGNGEQGALQQEEFVWFEEGANRRVKKSRGVGERGLGYPPSVGGLFNRQSPI